MVYEMVKWYILYVCYVWLYDAQIYVMHVCMFVRNVYVCLCMCICMYLWEHLIRHI